MAESTSTSTKIAGVVPRCGAPASDDANDGPHPRAARRSRSVICPSGRLYARARYPSCRHGPFARLSLAASYSAPEWGAPPVRLFDLSQESLSAGRDTASLSRGVACSQNGQERRTHGLPEPGHRSRPHLEARPQRTALYVVSDRGSVRRRVRARASMRRGLRGAIGPASRVRCRSTCICRFAAPSATTARATRSSRATATRRRNT